MASTSSKSGVDGDLDAHARMVARRRLARQWQECHSPQGCRQSRCSTFPGVVAFDLAHRRATSSGRPATACGSAGDGRRAGRRVRRRPAASAGRGGARRTWSSSPGPTRRGRADPRGRRRAAAARSRRASSRSAPAPSCSARPAGSTAGAARRTGPTRTQLARRHPTATVEPDVLYVDEGDLLTSAGVAAGIDLCLHIVAQRPRRGGRQPGRAADGRRAAPRGRPGAVHPAAGRRRADRRARGDARVDARAPRRAAHGRARWPRHAGYSPRTFARRFRAETGTTPLAWLLAAARRRRPRGCSRRPTSRSSTSPPSCGFGTATGLREHFRRAHARRPRPPTARRSARPGRPVTVAATPRATSTSVRVAKPEPPLAA